MLRPGDVLGHRYRLDGPIATGGMGEVWQATDVTLRRRVAVKLLHHALLADPQSEPRFAAEARTMAALTHPNIINVYDYGHAPPARGGGAYLVMSYVDGKPLSQRIAEAGRLPLAETASVLIQAAKALHAAHQGGIVHCDVKPANLLLAPGGSVTLVDFGVARHAVVNAATVGDVALGTALYMAPEQVTGQPVTPATDVYALGAVAYHCLAGRPPYTGNTPLQIALQHLSDQPFPLPPDVPPALRRLITRAMNKDPTRRYPTAADFAAAVRRALVGHSTTSSTTVNLPVQLDLPGHTRRPRRRAAPVASAVTMLVLGAAALAVLLSLAQRADTTPAARPSASTPSAGAAAAPGQTTAAPNQPAAQPDPPPPTAGAASAAPLSLAAQASQAPATATPSPSSQPSQPTATPSNTTTPPPDPPTPSPSTTTESPTPSTPPTAP
jgi:serine/threonine-protein kinase